SPEVTEPVSLNEFRYHRQLTASTPLPFDTRSPNETEGGGIVATASSGVSSEGHLSAQVFRKLAHDTELARFFDLTSHAITTLNDCLQELSAGRNLSADDKFMSAKLLFGELFMLREISDPVGLISITSLQAAARVVAVTDAPELPARILIALNRL